MKDREIGEFQKDGGSKWFGNLPESHLAQVNKQKIRNKICRKHYKNKNTKKKKK